MPYQTTVHAIPGRTLACQATPNPASVHALPNRATPSPAGPCHGACHAPRDTMAAGEEVMKMSEMSERKSNLEIAAEIAIAAMQNAHFSSEKPEAVADYLGAIYTQIIKLQGMSFEELKMKYRC